MTLPRQLALAALLGCAACVEAGEPVGEADVPEDDITVVSDPAHGGRPAQVDTPEEAEPDVCSVLPRDGACSVACDHAALMNYAPPGTCVVFVCDLTDGRVLTVHACRPVDE
ncbi:MAG: hypothetical protein JWP01_2688 [Myxococcales bacterium]|nr:hypothetical protein [Myxococcales bacterium]